MSPGWVYCCSDKWVAETVPSALEVLQHTMGACAAEDPPVQCLAVEAKTSLLNATCPISSVATHTERGLLPLQEESDKSI